MAKLENLSQEDTDVLQMQCVAFASGDFKVSVGNLGVRNYMRWDYDHPDEEDNPYDVKAVEQWVDEQKAISETLASLLKVLPASPDSSWRFYEWSESLSTPWADDLAYAISEAHEWLFASH